MPAPELARSAVRAAEYAGKEISVTFSLRYPFTACAKTLRDRKPVHYDALFKNCVAALNRRQIKWKLIREDEASATEYTLSFGNGGITEEGRGCFFHGIPELEAFLAGIDPGTTVTDNSGSLADEVIIREFTDGTFVILDTGNTGRPPRDLVLLLKGEKIPFTLNAFGVFTGESERLSRSHSLPVTPERYEFASPNLLRADMTDRRDFRFVLTKEMTVGFSIRTYEPVPVTLDGEELKGENAPCHLPECMKKLYLRTGECFFPSGSIYCLRRKTLRSCPT